MWIRQIKLEISCNTCYNLFRGDYKFQDKSAEELVSKGFDLYYFKSNKIGKLNFLIENKGEVIPLEFKSGKNYQKHIALNNVLDSKEYNISKAYILTNENVSVKDNKIYLPIYMIMFLKKYEIKDMIYKVDLSNI